MAEMADTIEVLLTVWFLVWNVDKNSVQHQVTQKM